MNIKCYREILKVLEASRDVVGVKTELDSLMQRLLAFKSSLIWIQQAAVHENRDPSEHLSCIHSSKYWSTS